ISQPAGHQRCRRALTRVERVRRRGRDAKATRLPFAAMAYANDDERASAMTTAQKALLDQITGWAENAGSPKSLLQLAEAYAWVVTPAKSRGVAATAPD